MTRIGGQIECRLVPVAAVSQVEREWRKLQKRADCNYFMSWRAYGVRPQRLRDTRMDAFPTATAWIDRIL